MVYLLALPALVLPVALVVAHLRGRASVTCCSLPADRDARLNVVDPR